MNNKNDVHSLLLEDYYHNDVHNDKVVTHSNDTNASDYEIIINDITDDQSKNDIQVRKKFEKMYDIGKPGKLCNVVMLAHLDEIVSIINAKDLLINKMFADGDFRSLSDITDNFNELIAMAEK